MVRVTLLRWRAEEKTDVPVLILVQEATQAEVRGSNTTGFYLSLLNDAGVTVAVFNEWAYAEVIKEEVNVVGEPFVVYDAV